jgi:hypothetical protein
MKSFEEIEKEVVFSVEQQAECFKAIMTELKSYDGMIISERTKIEWNSICDLILVCNHGDKEKKITVLRIDRQPDTDETSDYPTWNTGFWYVEPLSGSKLEVPTSKGGVVFGEMAVIMNFVPRNFKNVEEAITYIRAYVATLKVLLKNQG